MMEYQHARCGAEDGCSYKDSLRDAPHPALRLELVEPVKKHDSRIDGKNDDSCC